MTKPSKKSKHHHPSNGRTPGKGRALGRRRFLKKSAGTGLLGAVAATGASGKAKAQGEVGPSVHAPMSSDTRSTRDHQRRVDLCRTYVNEELLRPAQQSNNDEQDYSAQHYFASFTKTLPCNTYGEVDPVAFEALVDAMNEVPGADFASIPLDASASYKLANPQGALKYQSCGLDGHASRMPPSHRFASAELAGEMVEVYWQADTRDVPFAQYTTNNAIGNAINDLNALSVTPGQVSNGPVTHQTIFRGETPGDRVGPYISQFLWQEIPYGPTRIEQRYDMPQAHLDYMTDVASWLSIQKGAAPSQSPRYTGRQRYIFNGRTLAGYVHRDVSFQAYLNAALIALSYGPGALAPNNPYLSSANQGAFVSHGAPFILDLVTRAAQSALHSAWYQKWSVHRFLRPEAMAGRVHFYMMGDRSYPIHTDLIDSRALSRTVNQQGTYLLSQAYPEGSPTHPSYPAGHGCIAGACATVLKALFNESFVIPNPVEASTRGQSLLGYQGPDLTLGGEFNKLASNIALGRDTAGVHYRQDGIQGLHVGEQVAIALLREASSSGHETGFAGYSFVNFAGQTVQIQDGNVTI